MREKNLYITKPPCCECSNAHVCQSLGPSSCWGSTLTVMLFLVKDSSSKAKSAKYAPFPGNYWAFANLKLCLGVVTGVLQHKDTKKCIRFGTLTRCPEDTCKASKRGPFRLCSDNVAQLATSNCPMVKLAINGLVGDSGGCLHWFNGIDVFKVRFTIWLKGSKS